MTMTMEAPETLTDEPVTIAKDSGTSMDQSSETLAEEVNRVAEFKTEQQAEVLAEAASVIDNDERRFWMEIECLAKIKDCTRNIEMTESEIDDYQSSIKDSKEFLKGETIRLRRLGSELADIIDGKPLPIDPNKAKAPQESMELAGKPMELAEAEDTTWRKMPTSELLQGLKGLGAKKLDTICDAAATVGDLEDLRGEASRSHKSFKEVLPDGFGQKIADAIEDRLIEHVAKFASPSAEEQVKLNVVTSLDPAITEYADGCRSKNAIFRKAGAEKESFILDDDDNNDDLFLVGYNAYMEGTSLSDCPIVEDKGTHSFDENWVQGWVNAETVANWVDDDDEYEDVSGVDEL